MLGSRIQKVGKNMDNVIQVKPFGSVHDVELRFKFSLIAGFDGNCMGFTLVFFRRHQGLKGLVGKGERKERGKK
jgi:hypothetical protein